MKLQSSLRAAVTLALFGAQIMASSGCASPPKPTILDQATRLLKSEEAADLETIQPRHLREAKQAEIKARQAYEAGELDQARYYAYMAVQRYKTAQHFVHRSAASRQAQTMREAAQGLDKEEAQLNQERQEIERYEQLERSFSEMEGRLSSMRESQDGAQAQAARSLLAARNAQAEALALGGPSADAQRYAQARLLLESSLEGLERELYEESQRTSTQARALFEEVIEVAKKSDAGQRAKAQEQQELAAKAAKEAKSTATADATRPSTPTPANPDSGQATLRQLARESLDAAIQAQTQALAAQMNTQQPALYEQGVFLLQTAERRFGSDDFKDAISKANGASGMFARATDSNTSGAQANNSQAIEQAISAAEDERAALIGQGKGSDPALLKGDYALELARQALTRKDMVRALEKASEARAQYRVAQTAPSQASAPAMTPSERSSDEPVGALGATSGPRMSSKQGPRYNELDRMIVDLELKRAEAIGQLVPERCPGDFRAFEAILELANKRLEAGDTWRAFEFIIRAQAHLERCEQPKAPSDPKAEAAERARKEQLLSQRQKQQEQALDSLKRAQIAQASLSAKHPKQPLLGEPATLIEQAQEWFKRGQFEQSTALSARAIARQAELEDALNKEAAASKQLPATTTQPSASLTPAQQKALDKRCQQAQATLDQASGAQQRASKVELGRGLDARFKRAVGMMTRAKTSLKAADMDGCEDAEFLASEATASFEDIVADSTRGPSNATAAASTTKPATNDNNQDKSKPDGINVVVNNPNDPRPNVVVQSEAPLNPEQLRLKMEAQRDKEAQKTQATESLAKARLWKARAQGEQGGAVYKTADALLREAQRAADSDDWPKSAVLAEQAAGAFASIDQRARDDAQAQEAIWKPAYAKVIEALGRRDQVALKVGEPEQALFDQGKANLKRSREAWDAKEFFGAGKFADAALASFEKVEAQADARMLKEQEAKAQAAKEAEAKQTKEQEAKAKETKEAAIAAAKAREEAEAKAEAKTQKQLKDQADDAMRRLDVSYELCSKEQCAERDPEGWIRAKKERDDAQEAFKQGDFKRSVNLASSAMINLDQAKAKPRPFFVRAELSRVKRVGTQLQLDPKPNFNSGGASMTAASIKSVDELAVVLKDNDALIERVELVGFTDDRGKKTLNTELSKQRAQAVLDALVARGVMASKLVATGLGPESPIADNRTAAGRETNRRVEVRLTMKSR